MKPRSLVSLFLIMSLVLLGCRKTEPDSKESVEEETTIQVEPTDKALVVFFSRAGDQFHVGRIVEGNTAIVAKMISKKTGADLYEIKPKVDKYNLDYKQLAELAKKEQDGRGRPEYLKPAPDFSQYDVVFIGSPVWWGDWPMMMNSFFEDNELQGKKLIPFSTHAGSELARFDYRLANIYPYCSILKGLAVLGEDAQNDRDKVGADVDAWLKELGFEIKPSETSEDASIESSNEDSSQSPSEQKSETIESSGE